MARGGRKIRQRVKNNNGVTLLELVIAVIFVGVLASLALPKFDIVIEKMRASEAVAHMEATKAAQMTYALEHNGTYAQFIADLGLQDSTSNWTYLTNGDSAVIFVQAVRTSGPFQTEWIAMQYFIDTHAEVWSGTHPGTPGGPTS